MIKQIAQSIVKHFYPLTGYRPWSFSYSSYKHDQVLKKIKDNDILNAFRTGERLPEKFGYRLDERIIEYPWAFSHLDVDARQSLDAGSVLNFKYLCDELLKKEASWTIFTLSPERFIHSDRISYVFGDLRQTAFKDNWFDQIVSLSTIEHIGMDNALYSTEEKFQEKKADDYLLAVQELKRILKPGGKLLLTVPFGEYENHDWLQQFDEKMIQTITRYFEESNVSFYRYQNDGWQKVSAKECEADQYFNIHKTKKFTVDYLAAARSVACLELVKK